jgi:hypothetical protein
LVWDDPYFLSVQKAQKMEKELSLGPEKKLLQRVTDEVNEIIPYFVATVIRFRGDCLLFFP